MTDVRHLFTADEHQTDLGPATPEQIECSDNEMTAGHGIILIDENGEVVFEGTTARMVARGVRAVWVESP